ncbi:hypothetical protein EW146_g3924 [Bondarzewia mesenterica]|uniref:Branched-chain-amino-acid transaminase n=1 Tax=Bondarzewia mesenterica TaxID=1095465 RepID=A0A4S4LW15_9AGAM|nr:hypothetical protein EW146_g3924 [Bondarzewia mesenterica]
MELSEPGRRGEPVAPQELSTRDERVAAELPTRRISPPSHGQQSMHNSRPESEQNILYLHLHLQILFVFHGFFTTGVAGADTAWVVDCEREMDGRMGRTEDRAMYVLVSSPSYLAAGVDETFHQPDGPLSLDPSSTVFHYAQCLFEGLKAYRDANGKVTLFRPDMNMKRMNKSAQRIALPTFDGDALLELLKQLVRLDKHWIPQELGHSLYIRPVLIGTQNTIGITPPDSALLYVICSPVGPYYPNGFKPVALHGTTEHVRASPGGAQVGTMNLFVVFKHEDGTVELVTPPLDGMILPGVTRDSVLALARDHATGKVRLPELSDKLVVSERGVTMKEVKAAAQAGRLVELFGTGTAAVISPVDKVGYEGEDVIIPVEADGMGPVSRPLWKELVGRQMGTIPSEWSVVVD